MESEYYCVKDVSKEYKMSDKTLHILDGINLNIEKGEIVVIIGASGAGKSTLLHIMGLLDQPTSGAVFYKGINLNSIGHKQQALKRNQLFGFIFQFYHLLPDFNAIENVLIPTFIGRSFLRKGIGKSEARVKAESLLELVGLKDRVHHRPDQLSGGERQRVAITRALINDPEILLCDEPTGNLDSKTGMEIKELIWDINKRSQQTVVIVTHDENLAKYANRIIHVTDGKVVNS